MALAMREVDSGMCTHVGYDPETHELHMRHANQSTSIFSDVPEAVGTAVEGADSVGRAYHSMIKGQGYQHRYLS